MGCLGSFIAMIFSIIGSVLGLVFGIIGSIVSGIGIIIIVPLIFCVVLILGLVALVWFFSQRIRVADPRRESASHRHTYTGQDSREHTSRERTSRDHTYTNRTSTERPTSGRSGRDEDVVEDDVDTFVDVDDWQDIERERPSNPASKDDTKREDK